MSEMVAPTDDSSTNDISHKGVPTSAPFSFDLGGGAPPPNSQPSGADGMTDGINSQSNLGSMVGQMPNSMQPTQPQKSHLAEILGSHEMKQLQTMSRSYGSTPEAGGAQNMPP